jgi:hypothetical protein
MIKNLFLRLCGLLLAGLAFPPALVALLKGTPLFSHLYRSVTSPFWRWIWTAMPAIRYPIKNWNDLSPSLPGFVAVALLGIGLAVAFVKRKQPVKRRWEDEV